MDAKLSVIIPAFNAMRTLPKLLDSLERADRTGCELLLVDDGSTDETPVLAADRGLRVVRTPRNLGPSAARNLGVREARAPSVLFVDSDVVLHSPEGLQAVQRVLVDEPETTTVSTLSRVEPENPGFLPRYCALTERLIYERTSRGRREVCPWPDFSTRFGAIRRSAFAAVGGFDVRYPAASVEDADLLYRLAARGHRGHLLAWLEIGHHWPEDWLRQLRGWVRRAELWSQIFAHRRTMDDAFITQTEALRRGLDCLVPASLPLALLWPPAWIGTVVLEVLACWLKADLAAAFERRYGPKAALAAVGVHQLNSWALGAGTGFGILGRVLGRGRAWTP